MATDDWNFIDVHRRIWEQRLKNQKTDDFHVKGYLDQSTWAGEKGGAKISTNFKSPWRNKIKVFLGQKIWYEVETLKWKFLKF